MYVYQIIGNFFGDKQKMLEMSSMYESEFKNMPGLVTNSLFVEVKDEGVAAVQYVCEDMDTVDRIKVILGEVQKRFEENIGFSSEFVFKYVQHFEDGVPVSK